MSRAFVKESDGDDRVSRLPERPRSSFTNYVTPEGLLLLRERVVELMSHLAALAKSEDLADRQQIAALERDLRYFEARLETAIPVDPKSQPFDRVHFGSTVEVLGEDGNTQSFTIVGEDEADVVRGKISWVSPLAKALLDAQVGDEVTWMRPAGNRKLVVAAISADQAPLEAISG